MKVALHRAAHPLQHQQIRPDGRLSKFRAHLQQIDQWPAIARTDCFDRAPGQQFFQRFIQRGRPLQQPQQFLMRDVVQRRPQIGRQDHLRAPHRKLAGQRDHPQRHIHPGVVHQQHRPGVRAGRH